MAATNSAHIEDEKKNDESTIRALSAQSAQTPKKNNQNPKTDIDIGNIGAGAECTERQAGASWWWQPLPHQTGSLSMGMLPLVDTAFEALLLKSAHSKWA